MPVDISRLSWNTVTPELRSALIKLMQAPQVRDFRLVGGTALSLYLDHRISVDIDLFTDANYGSIDFDAIEGYLRRTFPIVTTTDFAAAMGKSYYIGTSKNEAIKLDLFYTDHYIRPAILTEEKVRLAAVEDIIAMKVEVVSNGGRMKDFWDLHELLDHYPVDRMLALHEERYPYSHDRATIKQRFTDFSMADDDFEPICLQGKHWEFIKLDLLAAVEQSH